LISVILFWQETATKSKPQNPKNQTAKNRKLSMKEKSPSENDHHFAELGVKIGVRRSRSMDALEDILFSYGLCR